MKRISVLAISIFCLCFLAGCGISSLKATRTPTRTLSYYATSPTQNIETTLSNTYAPSPSFTSKAPAPTDTIKATQPTAMPIDAISQTVYITKTGKKYHRDGCGSLSKSKIAISLSDAKRKGYTPCSLCNP